MRSQEVERFKQLSAACTSFRSDDKRKQHCQKRCKPFCGLRHHNKHQNASDLQPDLYCFVRSAVDPRHRHNEKLEVAILIPKAFWSDWVPTSKQTPLWPWLPGLIPHWQLQNRSQRCQGSSTWLSAGFSGWIWRDDHSDGEGGPGVRLWRHSRPVLRLQLRPTAASVKWGKPATSRSWVRFVVLIHNQPVLVDDRWGNENSLHVSYVCFTQHAKRSLAEFRINLHIYSSVY